MRIENTFLYTSFTMSDIEQQLAECKLCSLDSSSLFLSFFVFLMYFIQMVHFVLQLVTNMMCKLGLVSTLDKTWNSF